MQVGFRNVKSVYCKVLLSVDDVYTFQSDAGMLDDRRKELSINTIKKLCDGLDITLGEFFNTELFDNLEQKIK